MSIQNTAGIISECARKAELNGARVERNRIKAHIMDWNLEAFEAECESKHWDRQTAVGVYSSRLIAFINESPKRYNARNGGLQAKKSKSRKG